MPSSSQPSSKRMRTQNNDAQRPLDPQEELSQVAGLVERRRLQNKISQRNYRNRIRERLEALEALVDNTAKGQTANSSKSPGTTRTAKSGSVKRKLEGGSQGGSHAGSPGGSRQSPQHPSAALPSESSTSWNMGDFLDTSTAQFDTMYDFTAPHSPVSPQAFPDHVSTRECSPANHASSAMTSISLNPEQPAAAGLEKLDGSVENSRPLDEVPAHVSTGSMSPHTASGDSIPFGSLPAHVDRHEASSDHVSQSNPYPFPIPPLQSASYIQPQQFVWVPVPVMTLPPPPTQAPATMGPNIGRPPVIRPEALGVSDLVGRPC
ncbi:MAG: hypothetical protein Q9225_002042 [Loekoesia sp. 1 TL-2023]